MDETEVCGKDKVAYAWDAFILWADEFGVGLDHRDDWLPWWQCWYSAIDAKMELFLGRDES